jgi:hypothetical protein
MENQYKKYTTQAQMENKGEAFFESLISENCLAHRIFAPKDLGIDFICEWVHDDEPTGVIFASQVKTFSEINSIITEGGISKYNGLIEYKITNQNLNIGKRTLKYWKGLGIPVYLFAIGYKKDPNIKLNCYYKRFTPIVTKNVKQVTEFFFKVNKEDEFIAFAKKEERKLGFARDLYIDYMRWTYFKGYISYLNPRKIGLQQFPSKEDVFDDLFKEYEDVIMLSYKFTKEYIESSTENK